MFLSENRGSVKEARFSKLKALLERAAQYPAGRLLQEQLAAAGSARADGGVPNWTRYDGNYVRLQYWDG